MGSALKIGVKSYSVGPVCPVVGHLAQESVPRCAVTMVVSRETTRRLYHLRGHGRVRQDHPDAQLGGTVAFPGTRRHGNGGAGRSAGCPEDPPNSADRQSV